MLKKRVLKRLGLPVQAFHFSFIGTSLLPTRHTLITNDIPIERVHLQTWLSPLREFTIESIQDRIGSDETYCNKF